MSRYPLPVQSLISVLEQLSKFNNWASATFRVARWGRPLFYDMVYNFHFWKYLQDSKKYHQKHLKTMIKMENLSERNYSIKFLLFLVISVLSFQSCHFWNHSCGIQTFKHFGRKFLRIHQDSCRIHQDSSGFLLTLANSKNHMLFYFYYSHQINRLVFGIYLTTYSR